MAITAAGMKARYLAAIAGIEQTSDPDEAAAAADTVLLALFAAVVDELQANGHAVGNDSRGDTHSLTIE